VGENGDFQALYIYAKIKCQANSK